jgi:LysM repeat protein
MATVMNSEKETAELETLPEYIRESKGRSARETYELPVPRYQTKEYATDRFQTESVATTEAEPEAPPPASKGDMLETLWPGVHHELTQQPGKRSASFYLTVGFMAGAVISLVGVWLLGTVSPMVTSASKPSTPTVVTQNAKSATGAAPIQTSGDVIVPATPTYEVQSGDTLAAIALRNYKHCSPRLLDEICQANKLSSANVLNLGQKITLPTYHPNQATAKIVATSSSSPVQ